MKSSKCDCQAKSIGLLESEMRILELKKLSAKIRKKKFSQKINNSLMHLKLSLLLKLVEKKQNENATLIILKLLIEWPEIPRKRKPIKNGYWMAEDGLGKLEDGVSSNIKGLEISNPAKSFLNKNKVDFTAFVKEYKRKIQNGYHVIPVRASKKKFFILLLLAKNGKVLSSKLAKFPDRFSSILFCDQIEKNPTVIFDEMEKLNNRMNPSISIN